MLDNDVLAPGWEWRGPGKVKKDRKHYIRVDGSNFKYVGPGGGRGDKTIKCAGGYPYLKLAALTYCEGELRNMVESHHREMRRNLNSL